MLGRRAAIFAAASAGGLMGAAAHAQPVDVVVAHKSASGKHALAIALGKTVRITRFAVRVTARPNQRVTGYWSYHCRIGVTIGDRDADDFARKTPFTVWMRQPRMGQHEPLRVRPRGRRKALAARARDRRAARALVAARLAAAAGRPRANGPSASSTAARAPRRASRARPLREAGLRARRAPARARGALGELWRAPVGREQLGDLLPRTADRNPLLLE